MELCWCCGKNARFAKTKYGKGPTCSEKIWQCSEYGARRSHPSWNKGKTKETDQRLANQSGRMKGRLYGPIIRKHSEESKNKISASMKGNRNANHRGDRQSYYFDTRMDSRWEVGVAHYLDSIGSTWKYSEKSFVLSDGRHYYPDFFIYENDKFVKLIEVKGYFREANQLKFELFRREYPEVDVELWRGKDLFARGITNASGKIIWDMRELVNSGACKASALTSMLGS